MTIGFFVVGFLAICSSFLVGVYCGVDLVCERLCVKFEDVLERKVSIRRNCSSGKCSLKRSEGLVACRREHLLERCEERGYTLKEVMPCVTSQKGDEWVVDTNHPSYPRKPKHE